MWEGYTLPHDTTFWNCWGKIEESSAFPNLYLIRGLIKVGTEAIRLFISNIKVVLFYFALTYLNMGSSSTGSGRFTPRALIGRTKGMMGYKLRQFQTLPHLKNKQIILCKDSQNTSNFVFVQRLQVHIKESIKCPHYRPATRGTHRC